MIKLTRSLEWRLMFRDSLRLYFAPITGAIKGVRDEWARIDHDIAQRRAQQQAAQASKPAGQGMG